MKTLNKKKELLARFMGYEDYIGMCIPPGQLPYDTSWDWLMPVVVKTDTMISPIKSPVVCCNDISKTFEECVVFVDWYLNKQQKSDIYGTMFFARRAKFYYHYSKTESERLELPIMRLVVDGKEFFLDGVICEVPCHSDKGFDCAKMVMVGECSRFYIKDNIGVLSGE